MEVSYYYFKQYCLFCLLYLWTMGKKELKDKQRRQVDIGANFQVWSIIVFITSMAAPNYWLRINLFIFLVHGNFNQLWAVATPCLLILENYFTQFVRKRNIYNRGKYPMKCWSGIYWACYLTLYFRRVSCLPFGKQFKKIYIWKVAGFGTIRTI